MTGGAAAGGDGDGAPTRSAGSAAGVADFAHAWAKGIRAVTYVPLTWVEMSAYLHGLAGRLATALRAERFDPGEGYRVGDELVAANFMAPEALSRTLSVIYTRLLSDLGLPDVGLDGGGLDGVGLDGAEAARRLEALAEAVAIGHGRAVRHRALDGQEGVRRAAIEARVRAERELRVSQERVRFVIHHDDLTGLPNHVFFAERLRGAFVDRSGRMALCIIGLDGFTALYDSVGPAVGAKLLVAVADRLSDVVAGLGHVLARLDRDEFALLIEETHGPDDAVKAVEIALRSFVEPFAIDGMDLWVRASAGIAEGAKSTTDAIELMRAGRISLHFAKADGGSRYMLFDEHRSAEHRARYEVSAAMPGALDRDEFTLAYQPLVALATGRTAGVEALARWHHEYLGTVPPDRFIPVAEDTGMIIPLGRRLLEMACRQAAAWAELTADPPYISVNLAGRQIRQPSIVTDVTGVLASTGLPANRLQLEITESTLYTSGDQALPAMRALAELGVRLAIDDFGVGYANHGYLRDLPIDNLKLAAPLTRRLLGATADGKDEAILAHLVGLGHILGLSVTAEGIETEPQARILQDMGCDLGQGWHLGRPKPVDEIAHLISKG